MKRNYKETKGVCCRVFSSSKAIAININVLYNRTFLLVELFLYQDLKALCKYYLPIRIYLWYDYYHCLLDDEIRAEKG